MEQLEDTKKSIIKTMKSDYGFEKYDKTKELNPSMTITEKPADEYDRTIHNIGGNN